MSKDSRICEWEKKARSVSPMAGHIGSGGVRVLTSYEIDDAVHLMLRLERERIDLQGRVDRAYTTIIDLQDTEEENQKKLKEMGDELADSGDAYMAKVRRSDDLWDENASLVNKLAKAQEVIDQRDQQLNAVRSASLENLASVRPSELSKDDPRWSLAYDGTYTAVSREIEERDNREALATELAVIGMNKPLPVPDLGDYGLCLTDWDDWYRSRDRQDGGDIERARTRLTINALVQLEKARS
jgi:hypothetical protein